MYQIIFHRNPQASYNYQVRDEVSNDMIEWSIESPDTLAERNGICAASLFQHLLTEHATFLKGTEDLDSSDKFQSIANKMEDGYDTAVEKIDGKTPAMVNKLPMMQTKNVNSKEECSVSSGKGGEKKQEQSLDDDIEVEVLADKEGSNLVTPSQQPIENALTWLQKKICPLNIVCPVMTLKLKYWLIRKVAIW